MDAKSVRMQVANGGVPRLVNRGRTSSHGVFVSAQCSSRAGSVNGSQADRPHRKGRIRRRVGASRAFQAGPESDHGGRAGCALSPRAAASPHTARAGKRSEQERNLRDYHAHGLLLGMADGDDRGTGSERGFRTTGVTTLLAGRARGAEAAARSRHLLLPGGWSGRRAELLLQLENLVAQLADISLLLLNLLLHLELRLLLLVRRAFGMLRRTRGCRGFLDLAVRKRRFLVREFLQAGTFGKPTRDLSLLGVELGLELGLLAF